MGLAIRSPQYTYVTWSRIGSMIGKVYLGTHLQDVIHMIKLDSI